MQVWPNDTLFDAMIIAAATLLLGGMGFVALGIWLL